MDPEKLNVQAEFQALKSDEVALILRRCQRYVENSADSKLSSDEIRGMVRLIKHIKDIESEFNAHMNT